MSKVKDKSKQRLHLFYNNNLAQAALLDHPFIINALLHNNTLHLCSTYVQPLIGIIHSELLDLGQCEKMYLGWWIYICSEGIFLEGHLFYPFDQ